MNCCSDNSQVETLTNVAEDLALVEDQECASCGGESRTVTRKTVLLMLKPECFDSMGEDEYRFCANPECRVVYFSESGAIRFTTHDLRIRVGLKENEGSVPLCYCFGFDEADVREEIAATGRCSIPLRVASLIRRGMCACLEKNPTGTCCLGEINRTVKRLGCQSGSPDRTLVLAIGGNK